MSLMDRGSLEDMEGYGLALAHMWLPKVIKHLRWARMNLNTIRYEYPVTAAQRKNRAVHLHQELTDIVVELAHLEQRAKDARALAVSLFDEHMADKKGGI